MYIINNVNKHDIFHIKFTKFKKIELIYFNIEYYSQPIIKMNSQTPEPEGQEPEEQEPEEPEEQEEEAQVQVEVQFEEQVPQTEEQKEAAAQQFHERVRQAILRAMQGIVPGHLLAQIHHENYYIGGATIESMEPFSVEVRLTDVNGRVYVITRETPNAEVIITEYNSRELCSEGEGIEEDYVPNEKEVFYFCPQPLEV
jgi:hypothetical protein